MDFVCSKLICLKDVADVQTPTRPHKRGASGRSGSPLGKRQKIPPGLTAHPDTIRGKRTMSHFTPRTARVMAKVKTVARGNTVTTNAFISPETRPEYYRSLIVEVAHDPKLGSEEFVETVQRILRNCVESGSLTIFGDFVSFCFRFSCIYSDLYFTLDPLRGWGHQV